MQYYKITNKRLVAYRNAIELHQQLKSTWNEYIEKLTALKNEKGVRLVPGYTGFKLGDNGPTCMLPMIVAFKFRHQIQLKAIREKIWEKTAQGFYVLNRNGEHIENMRRVRNILYQYTLQPTIFNFYQQVFAIKDVPLGAEDAPEEINKAVTETVKELCEKGTDPVVVIVPRFFVTKDAIPVIGLPEQMPFVPQIKQMIDKKQLIHIDNEELTDLAKNRDAVINSNKHA